MAEKPSQEERGREFTREDARAQEEDFHGRLRGKFGALVEVFNPLDGRVYFVDPSARHREWDESERVKRIMLEEGVLDRSIRRRMPMNRASRLDIGTKGLLSGFTPHVSVVGISLSPLRVLSVGGAGDAEIEFPDLESAVKRAADRIRVFHYVGVFGTVPFSEECVDQPPRSRNLITILVERGEDTEWRVLNDEALPWPGALRLFDLETVSEKVSRCRRTILEHEDLRMKGGHIRLEETKKELGFPEEVFDRALGEILSGPGEFQIREFDGTKILQRARF
ncbi:MAG: hypothetical protein ACYTHM_13655 [Planctomycetota bacterium]